MQSEKEIYANMLSIKHVMGSSLHRGKVYHGNVITASYFPRCLSIYLPPAWRVRHLTTQRVISVISEGWMD